MTKLTMIITYFWMVFHPRMLVKIVWEYSQSIKMLKGVNTVAGGILDMLQQANQSSSR